MRFVVKVKPDAEGVFNCLRGYEKVIELEEATVDYEIWEIKIEEDVSILLDLEEGVIEYEIYEE